MNMSVILLSMMLLPVSSFAQVPAPEQAPAKVGEGRASEYFKSSKRAPASSGEHYLGIHLGNYLSSTAYRWGKQDREKSVAKFSGGITYRFGEWVNFGDSFLRIDFSSYEFDSGERATKMGLLATVLMPDVSSQFPFYFGGAIGPGVFFKQIDGESALSLDYQLLLGLRFLNVFESTGFFLEGGLKNHIHLLSDGQLNGSFLTGGLVFTF